MNKFFRGIAGMALAFIFCPTLQQSALAAWSADPIAVAITTALERRPQVVYDGAGGYFVTWFESSGTGVYAQHYSSKGDTTWDAPLQVTDDSGAYQLEATTDGNGGLLLSWTDGDGNIGVQCVTREGTAVWDEGGVVAIDEAEPWIAPDGDGGAIVMSYNYKVNRVASDGSLPWGDYQNAPAYTASGDATKIVPDGDGGAILVWHESGVFTGVAVQKVDHEGDFVWNDGDAVQLSADGASISCPRLTPSAGGAIVAWFEGDAIMAQKVSASGNVLWTAGGVEVASDQEPTYVAVVSDGEGGAFVTWSNGGEAVRAQRVDEDGQVLWDDPVAMSTAANLGGVANHPTFTVPDGLGGFIATWYNSDSEIIAQRCDADGELLWSETGALLGSAESVYYDPKLTTNGQGGAVVVWVDNRTGTGTDIFMQSVNADGEVGTLNYSTHKDSDGSSGLCFLEALGASASPSAGSIAFFLVAGVAGVAALRRR